MYPASVIREKKRKGKEEKEKARAYSKEGKERRMRDRGTYRKRKAARGGPDRARWGWGWTGCRGCLMQDGCSGSQRLLRLQTRVREEIQLVAELPNVKETPHGVRWASASCVSLSLSLPLSFVSSPSNHHPSRKTSTLVLVASGILPLDAPSFAEIDDDASR